MALRRVVIDETMHTRLAAQYDTLTDMVTFIMEERHEGEWMEQPLMFVRKSVLLKGLEALVE